MANDMDNFFNAIKNEVKKKALNHKYDFECPHCSQNFKVTIGKNTCPECGLVVDFKTDDSWDKI